MIEGIDDNQKTGLLQVIIPSAEAIETVNITHQQLRRGVRPLGRRDHQRHAQVGHQRAARAACSSSATTRRPTPATTSRTPQPPAKFVNGGFTLGGPILQQQAVLLRRLPAHPRQQRLRRPRARCRRSAIRNGDFSASPTKIYDPLTGNAGGTNRDAVRRQHHPGRPHQPDRAQAAREHAAAEHRRRGARSEQLPEAQMRVKTTDVVRHQGQLHDQRRRIRCRTASASCGRCVFDPGAFGSTAVPPTAASPAPARTRATAPASTRRACSAARSSWKRAAA